MKTNTTSGFTIIEMLIIVAIIAILVGIVLPSYINAKKRANDVIALSCASGLARNAVIYEMDKNKLMIIDKPPIEKFLKGEEYEVRECAQLVDLDKTSVSVSYNSSDYLFTVKHSGGSTKYSISNQGITGTRQ